jgi:hypothetical protein
MCCIPIPTLDAPALGAGEELPAAHPPITVSPNTGSEQAPLRQFAAAHLDCAHLGHPNRAMGEGGSLASARDAYLRTNFFLGFGKARLPSYHESQ